MEAIVRSGEGSGRRARAGNVAAQLAAIPTLPRAALVERWTAAYGRPPPKGLSRRLLEYAAAYHIQAKAFGGLKPAVARELRRRVMPVGEAPSPSPRPSRDRPHPGSRLIREWHGRTYTVEVVEAGFVWEGRRYRSLSEIARAITGARWSGPKFFGL